MSIKSLNMNSGRLCVVFALSLLAQYPAAADQIKVDSSNGGIAINPTIGTGGNLPKTGGTYNLDAWAHDTTAGVNKAEDKKGPLAYQNIAAGSPDITDSAKADQAGQRFDPNALAKITYTSAGKWNSTGSFASVCSSDPKAKTCGPNPNFNGAEGATAFAQVRDPWNFSNLIFDLTFDNTVTFDAGLSLQAWTDSGDFGQASLLSDASTDLNGLGDLWKFSWTTDSISPGVSQVSFWSNPALGLNDALIASNFQLLVSSDPATGTSTLTQPFSFDYQLTVPAGASAQFTGSATYEAVGVTSAPEPSSLVLALMGASSLLVSGVLKRAKA